MSKISLLLPALFFALFGVVGCNSFEPEGGDDGHIEMVHVTPTVVMQLQERQKAPSISTNEPLTPLLQKEDYAYRIGVNDIIHLKFYIPSVDGYMGSLVNQLPPADNWRDYSGVLVKEDGNISFPYIGEIKFADKTVVEAKHAIEQAMAHYFRNPQAIIEVKEFRGRRVLITGEVKKPGEQYLRAEPLDAIKAIQAADGLQDTADLSGVTLTHKDNSVEKVDLASVIYNGDMRNNRVLQDGDVLHIPANYGNKVFVMGEIKSPNMQHIKSGKMSVMEALASASGPDNLTASYEHIYVIRGAINDQMSAYDTSSTADGAPVDSYSNALHTTVYHLDSSTGTGMALAAQFPLQPNDVVYVSPSAIGQWSKIVNQVIPSNALYLLSLGILATRQ